MAEYDISSKLSSFLDPNLMLNVLEFLSQKGLYDKNDIIRRKVDLLLKTNMITRISNILSENPDLREYDLSVTNKSQQIESLHKLYKYNDEGEPTKHFDDHRNLCQLIEYNKSTIKADTTGTKQGIFDQLLLSHNLDLENLVDYHVCELCVKEVASRAKFYCDCGDYSRCLDYLEIYIGFNIPKDNTYILSIYWGALLCSICLHNIQKCENYYHLIHTLIESLDLSPLQMLQQRLYLLHWCLLFCMESKTKLFVDLCFFSRKVDKFNDLQYLYTLQIYSPWLLRYLISAILIEERQLRDNHLRDIMRLLRTENNINDPIVNFLQSLMIDYDFEKAQSYLTLFESLISNDYILSYSSDFSKTLMKSARCLVFELYCKIYQILDLNVLAEKLNFNVEETEKWIVDLLRSTSLNVDARIDNHKSTVSLLKSPTTLYHHIFTRTRQIYDKLIVMSNINNKT